MNMRFPITVAVQLSSAGWFPGRNVGLGLLPRDFELFDRATKALQEFGGLQIGKGGPGIECATSHVDFRPQLGDGLSAVTGLISPSGGRLFPLGELDYGHAFLLIDEDGKIFLFFDSLEQFAPSLDRALIQLLLGLAPGSVWEIGT